MLFSYASYASPVEEGYGFNTYLSYAIPSPWGTYAGTSTADLIAYYANLLILQYRGKPKAYATISAVVAPVIMDQLPTQVQDAFSITEAVGVQLDVIGQYVGVSRTANTSTGEITLSDSDFVKLIQVGIVNNSNSSSLAAIQDLLFRFFPGEIKVFDYANMQMSYYLNSLGTSLDLAKVFISEGLLPHPMGVQIASVIYSPFINEFFGCRTYDLPGFDISPLNNYDSYQTDYPFLTYSEAL